MTAPPIEIRGLAVRYGADEVLRAIDLAVEAGTVHALLGRNGSGKTSLVRCLLGLQRADGGSVHLLGEDAWRRRATVLRRVGVVPETPDVPPAMSTRQASLLCRSLYPVWRHEPLVDRLSRGGIAVDRPFSRLSRGQKAQVSLALATAHDPELLILDDPTLGLDAVAREALLGELVDELGERPRTVLLTTHDLRLAERLADGVSVLAEGSLRVSEPLESLKARFRQLWLPPALPADEAVALLPDRATRRRHGKLGLEAVVEELDDESVRQLEANGGRVTRMELEEIFHAVAGDTEEVGR